MLGVVDRHAYQSAKLADTVVDVYHVVAYLELLNLLQRQGYLSAMCLVGAQAVLVVAVEYLVVGKYAELPVVVGKAGVERLINK